MFDYIKGVVTTIHKNYIIVENNGIGYLIYTANPFSFKENEDVKVYLYQNVREEELSLYGFKTIEEKELFLKLIEVKGVGPKMTLPIIAAGSISGIVDAIERENVLYLKKFPKIGDKLAKQIILDLKGKLTISINDNSNNSNNDELLEVLQGLGYKVADIKKVLPLIDNNQEIGNQVKEALRLLLK